MNGVSVGLVILGFGPTAYDFVQQGWLQLERNIGDEWGQSQYQELISTGGFMKEETVAMDEGGPTGKNFLAPEI